MTIDWNSFTPWPSLAGGVFIGISAAMFVLLNGRIAAQGSSPAPRARTWS